MARILYRVEHRDAGQGPFTGPNNEHIYERYMSWFNKLPCVWEDGLRPHMTGLTRCAFPSKRILRKWMQHKDVPEQLQKHGYVVKVFRPMPYSRVYAGRSGEQVVFDPATVKPLRTYNPLEVLT